MTALVSETAGTLAEEQLPSIETIPVKRLEKVTFADMQEKVAAWQKAMHKRDAALANKTSDKGSFEIALDFGNGFKLVRLLTEEALRQEGVLMGHCVGDKSDWLKNPNAAIYSLRDGQGEPHATIGIQAGQVVEAKGKSNKPVIMDYVPYMQAAAINFGWKINNDQESFVIIISNDDDFVELKKLLDKIPNSIKIYSLEIKEYTTLTSLEGLPAGVEKLTIEQCERLTSLEGIPAGVEWLTIWGCNGLTSLEGLPAGVEWLTIWGCDGLTSLKGLSAGVEGLTIWACPSLTSLKGIPESLKNLTVEGKEVDLKALRAQLKQEQTQVSPRSFTQRLLRWAGLRK